MQKQVNSFKYAPSRLKGILFLTFSSILLAVLEVFLINRMQQIPLGIQFSLLLIAAFLTAAPLFLFLWRLYSLIFSSYKLERNGVHIRWGMRGEIIPLNAIEWIRNPSEMPYEVPWSVLPMPGAYLGTVENENYGKLEFLASDISTMLFLGTANCVYVISPRYPDQFTVSFERILQMGSLSDINWTTVRPAGHFLDAWKNKICRVCTIVSVNLLTLMFLWIGFRFPFHENFALQFSPMGRTEEILPAQNILLLPILASISWGILSLLGVRLYQMPETKKTAELVWGSGLLIILQFIAAAVMIF